MTTRTFHLGDILSVTTERMLSPTHLDGLFDILNWMTGDNLFSHQLPRAAQECQGPLLAQHPDLADIEVPDWPDGVPVAIVQAWLAEQVTRYGETREVTPLAPEEHTHIDPITEMQRYHPGGVVVIVPNDYESEGPF